MSTFLIHTRTTEEDNTEDDNDPSTTFTFPNFLAFPPLLTNCPHGHFYKNVKPSLDCVAFTSTPLHSTTTIPHNASLCDNPLALNSRAVTPTPPELTSTQQHSPLYPAFPPGRSCSRPACVPPRLEYYVAATEACPAAAAKLAATPLQTQNPQICPEKWHLEHLLGGLDTGREENETTERERIPRLDAASPLLGSSPNETGNGSLRRRKRLLRRSLLGRVASSRRLSRECGGEEAGGGMRGREGVSDGGVPAGGRGMNACMPEVEWVSTNVISFLN